MRKIVDFALHPKAGIIALSNDGRLYYAGDASTGSDGWMELAGLPQDDFDDAETFDSTAAAAREKASADRMEPMMAKLFSMIPGLAGGLMGGHMPGCPEGTPTALCDVVGPQGEGTEPKLCGAPAVFYDPQSNSYRCANHVVAPGQPIGVRVPCAIDNCDGPGVLEDSKGQLVCGIHFAADVPKCKDHPDADCEEVGFVPDVDSSKPFCTRPCILNADHEDGCVWNGFRHHRHKSTLGNV